MWGVVLTAIGNFFLEISSAIGKKEAELGKETTYSLAFLSLFWGTFWFLGIILWKNAFLFSLDSLPTFITRVILEIVQIHIATVAIVKADRSTFSFIRTLTIPLLLLTDIGLGYTFGFNQFIGIGLILFSLLMLFLNHGISKTGIGFVFLSAIGSVVTISLYQYDIRHFNAVEAEQFLISAILLLYFFLLDVHFKKENPLKLMKQKIFFFQSFSDGLGGVIESFAYLFAPAAIIVAAKRSTAVLWSVLVGNFYFHEKNLILKIVLFLVLGAGIVLLV